MRILKSVIKLVLTLFIARRIALAYIDPNTGGMLFQALVVIFGLLTGMIYFLSARIKMLFAKLRRSPQAEDVDGDNIGLSDLLEDMPDSEPLDKDS